MWLSMVTSFSAASGINPLARGIGRHRVRFNEDIAAHEHLTLALAAQA